MTNEEAKTNLEKLLLLYDDGMIDFSAIRKSVKMAIEALQKFDVIATDIISRQDAIDLAYDCEDEFGKDVAFRFAYYLKQLPSAQLEIIHCKDCRHYNSNDLSCILDGSSWRDNDFCSCAVRRTNG